MQNDGSHLTLDGANDEYSFDYGINQTAHSQIAARLGIPLKYYQRMQVEAPSLLATNVNEWFVKNRERRMIRLLDNNMRAFLGDRYQRIDNAEIAEVALPVLAQLLEVRIVSSQTSRAACTSRRWTPDPGRGQEGRIWCRLVPSSLN
jgi:hypothetical protein